MEAKDDEGEGEEEEEEATEAFDTTDDRGEGDSLVTTARRVDGGEE